MCALSERYVFLLLEDDPLDAELARGRLLAGGLTFDMVVADSRESFYEEFTHRRFDLVLADYSLPDFNGLAALQHVRESHKRLPFIFVSGVLGEDVAVEALLQGATDYVTKQKLDRLVPAVVRALSEHAEHLSRERVERELRHVEERLAKIANSVPAMVWTCSREGNLTFANSLWARHVGPAGCWFDAEIIHPADRPSCERVWKEAQEVGRPFHLECRYKMVNNGTYRWQLVRAAPLEHDSDGVVEWVGSCTDVEVQKQRDIQLQTAEKLALTGRMASVVAHEINNPLEALMNILYLARAEVYQGSSVDSYLVLAENEVLRMTAITKQTLQWSRDEGVISEVSAEKLIEETLNVFAAKLKNKEVQLERAIDTRIKIRVIAGEIRQVLANLISNAIDAVPVGGTIVIGVAPLSLNNRPLIELMVGDNGHGIPPDILPELFSPFNTTKGQLGNGLGLYISKEIVDRHNGQLIVDSTVHVGTRIRVLLPSLSRYDHPG